MCGLLEKLGMEAQGVSDSVRGSTRSPRLFIKEMVMRNFKSYAGEQRVGPFHKVEGFISVSGLYFFGPFDLFCMIQT